MEWQVIHTILTLIHTISTLIHAISTRLQGDHSGIVGYALDGYPIYGPVGYCDGEAQAIQMINYHIRTYNCYIRSLSTDGHQI